MKKIEEILEAVTDFLNSEGIDYVIVGGIAVIVYGNPRTTADIDLIVKLDEEGIEDFAEYLQGRGFLADIRDMRQAFKEKTHFSAEEKDSLFRLDIKGVYREKEKITLRNRKKVEYDGITMYVASPEDTIANKLYYGSEQDVEDAESIYVRQEGGLDQEYLEERCEAVGVKEKLEKMKKEIEQLMEG